MNEKIALSIEIGRQLEKAREDAGMTTGDVAFALDLDHVRPDICIRARERNGVQTLPIIIEHCLVVGADPKEVISKAVGKYLNRRSTPTG